MIDTSGGTETSVDDLKPLISKMIDEQLQNRTAAEKVKRPTHNQDIKSVLKDIENILASDESDDTADNNLTPQAKQRRPKLNLTEIGIQTDTAEEYIEEYIEETEEEVEEVEEEEGDDPLQQLTEALNLDSEPEQPQQYLKFFKPAVKLCLAMGNYDYSIVRDHLDRGFDDLPAA